jgi:hypothetical protein
MSFSQYIAIDWSGAKPGNYRGKIQVAVCEAGNGAPTLYNPNGNWTRTAIADWLRHEIAPKQTALVGMDFSFAAPFLDKNDYLPGLSRARQAKDFWKEVNDACAADDFGAAEFLETHRGTHFYLGKADGEKSRFMRLRQCETSYNKNGGRKPSSVFDAIGAAQVAKASFTGMRLLHHVSPVMPVWPFDSRQQSGAMLVEIYCQAFIRHAGLSGLKVRTRAELNIALKKLGSRTVSEKALGSLTDDKTDALISAAGLRKYSADPGFWQPEGLTPEIACTEGWTFGVP